MSDPLLEQLASIVGPAQVLVDADLRAGYETDWSGRFSGTARAVVRPASTQEVAAVLRACNAAGAAVVAQGGNTGLVGGSVPRGGEAVLSVRRLAAIDPIDRDHGEVVVGAGAVLADVQAAARRVAWDVGVDLSARGSATIGGMVATNAGGQQLLRYGPMLHQVIGLEAVRADGSVLGHVPALRKDNTGYPWAGVLAGSEGTLAVITRVHLKLVPWLPERVVALLAFEDLAPALAACGVAQRELDALVALEVVFADGIDLVCEHTGLPLPFARRWAVVLLLECGGRAGTMDTTVDALARAVDAMAGVGDSAVAADETTRERLWAYRDRHAEAINAAGVPHKLDVTVPFSRLADFEQVVRTRVREVAPGARAIVFGHLGDGNLHVNVLGLDPEDDRVDRAVLELAASMGGSISAEHGIGVAKREFLHLSRTAGEIAAMQSLKHALDPRGILNPGVLLPD